jgi:hypothetical protein
MTSKLPSFGSGMGLFSTQDTNQKQRAIAKRNKRVIFDSLICRILFEAKQYFLSFFGSSPPHYQAKPSLGVQFYRLIALILGMPPPQNTCLLFVKGFVRYWKYYKFIRTIK